MSSATHATAGPGRAGYGLLLLFLSNVLNLADRSLLGIVIDPVRVDLHLSDTQMSLVAGFAFVLFNLLCGIVIARQVDRGNRKWILAVGIVVWSVATMLTGLAQGFWSLAAARMLVGVGEAVGFPVALSLIGDLFAAPKRPRAVAIFQASTFIGVVLGSVLAGVLAAAHGWRTMFAICGAAGLAVALLVVLTLREPARGGHDGRAHTPEVPQSLAAVLAFLGRTPGFAWLALGYALSGMAVAVLPTWAPTFLLRTHHVNLAEVGKVIGPAVGLGGITGTVLSGLAASWLVRRRGSETAALLVPLVAMPLAAPFYAGFLFLPALPGAISSVAVTNFLLASSLGPCVAMAIGMVPPGARGLASTMMLTAQGLVGAALAPLLVGLVSDALAPTLGQDSLRYALAMMIAAPILASLCLWLSYRQQRAIRP